MARRSKREKLEAKSIEAAGLAGAAIGLVEHVRSATNPCRASLTACAGKSGLDALLPFVTHALWGAAIGTVLAVTLVISLRWRSRTPPRLAAPRRAISERTRHDVWRRDRGQCVDCGSRGRLEFDHIIPFSKGGSNTPRNLELRCEPCNRRKGARI